MRVQGPPAVVTASGVRGRRLCALLSPVSQAAPPLVVCQAD